MMSGRAKRNFIGIISTGRSSMNIRVAADDEASATKALQVQYGAENIIEIRCDEAAAEQMSQAEADVGRAVIYNLTGAWFAFAKWVLRGAFRK